MKPLEKWKKSVIHLECPASSQPLDELVQSLTTLQQQLQKGEITSEEYLEGSQKIGFHDIRCQGTAVFIQHNGHRYLFTARHVVHDEVTAKRQCENDLKRISGRAKNDAHADLLIANAKERANDCIFRFIYRVPSLDEYYRWTLEASPILPPKPLEWLSVIPGSKSYSFSDPDLDLAVISLDQRYSHFADELVSMGYAPVNMEDIADEPSAEGADVFTVGYPGATALQGRLDLLPALRNWQSFYISVPNFSFGRVSMLHHCLPFFWCDMSVYPGNSGGPVIENDKLAGVVSAQPKILSKVVDKYDKELPLVATTRIPFSMTIKGKFVKDLLETQICKDIAESA